MIKFTKKAPEYEMAMSRGRTRKSLNQPLISISNSIKSCKKINIHRDVYRELDRPKTVKVGFTKTGIVIGHKLEKGFDIDKYFVIRQYGSTYAIFSTQLVREINRRFDIKYSEKSSCKFENIEYSKENGNTIVHILLVTKKVA